MTTEEEPSYIDYEAFLSPDFSPSAFANTLVLSTNNPNDTPLDLSTPLSRVLFDIQEVDSHIDALTTKHAIPLLEFTREQNETSKRIITELDTQIQSLNDSYKQLERDVIDKHAEADEVRNVAMRLWETLRLGRSVSRCLQLGRQLEVQHADATSAAAAKTTAATGKRGDHRALIRCAHTILSLREILDATAPGEEGHGLDRVDAIRSLKEGVTAPLERSVRETAERIIRDFAVPETATFIQAEETRARTVSAMATLFLLSPTKTANTDPDKWTPALLLHALETYLRTALQSSTASLSRALGQLPTLDRAFSDISARCRNIVALEMVLAGAKPPAHPLVTGEDGVPRQQGLNMLQPLLAHLETGRLASYFWRTMASGLAPRVQEIMARGGVSARTLRSNRQSVADGIRECVYKGCRVPEAMEGRAGKEEGWDREVAVMVGSVMNNIR
ncbi:hypothetical protein ACRALDRAFT_1066348 [Sodiomyces alcalophilus JCM 7366]|uniref:uncharacterized protein n=1 Tax=Sodiomyces alcalophilus JCM 7366 TaxID=591952 RepID=UPI0039B6E60A